VFHGSYNNKRACTEQQNCPNGSPFTYFDTYQIYYLNAARLPALAPPPSMHGSAVNNCAPLIPVTHRMFVTTTPWPAAPLPRAAPQHQTHLPQSQRLTYCS